MFPTLPDGLFVCFCYDLYVISEGDREDTDPSRNLLIATFDTDFIKFLQNRINVHIFFSSPPDPSLHVLMHHQQAVTVFHCITKIMGNHNSGQLFLPYNFIGKLHNQSAVFGSSAAVCSSRIRKSIGVIVDIRSDIACLCPPDKEPTFTSELIFQPQIQLTQLFLIERDSALICSHAQTKEFSFVICHGHIFQNGHIRTGAHCRVLVYPSDSAQTTVFFFFGNILPFNEYLPAVRVMLPHTMFNIEVFPEPLLPTTDTNCPFLIERLKSSNRHISFTVPGL